MGAAGILLIIYLVMNILLCPVIYQVYRKGEVK